MTDEQCIHCEEAGQIVKPEDHNEEYNYAICSFCERYQVEDGTVLLEDRFSP
jgi:hypothetical protein